MVGYSKICWTTYFNTIYMIMTQYLWPIFSFYILTFTKAEHLRPGAGRGSWVAAGDRNWDAQVLLCITLKHMWCTGIITHMWLMQCIAHKHKQIFAVSEAYHSRNGLDPAGPLTPADGEAIWRFRQQTLFCVQITKMNQTSHQKNVYGMYIICVTRVSAVSAPHPPK